MCSKRENVRSARTLRGRTSACTLRGRKHCSGFESLQVGKYWKSCFTCHIQRPMAKQDLVAPSPLLCASIHPSFVSHVALGISYKSACVESELYPLSQALLLGTTQSQCPRHYHFRLCRVQLALYFCFKKSDLCISIAFVI